MIFCGGLLIDFQWVVIVFYCLYEILKYFVFGKILYIEVVLGELDQEKKDQKEVVVNVLKLFLYGQYNLEILDYDIVLFKLKDFVKLFRIVKFVCFFEESFDFKFGINCYVIGFGVIEQGGDVVNIF